MNYVTGGRIAFIPERCKSWSMPYMPTFAFGYEPETKVPLDGAYATKKCEICNIQAILSVLAETKCDSNFNVSVTMKTNLARKCLTGVA